MKQEQVKLKVSEPELIERYDKQTNIIIGIFVVTTLVLIVMVATLIIDCFHFNSVSYREYSSGVKIQNELIEENQKIMEINRKNQELIQELLNKKGN